MAHVSHDELIFRTETWRMIPDYISGVFVVVMVFYYPLWQVIIAAIVLNVALTILRLFFYSNLLRIVFALGIGHAFLQHIYYLAAAVYFGLNGSIPTAVILLAWHFLGGIVTTAISVPIESAIVRRISGLVDVREYLFRKMVASYDRNISQ